MVGFGNPAPDDEIQSSGFIAGTAKEVGRWREAYILDMTILPGMSGGGIVDETGRVVGVMVGLRAVNLGFASAPTGFGVGVPASVACRLMARAT